MRNINVHFVAMATKPLQTHLKWKQ